ncbi:MAG TPA: hypothetical protein VM529_25720 [Gemmata sp.]|nr:hypothetical protein [Gemmata sp.]
MRGMRFAVAGLMVAGMFALVQAQPGGGFGRGGFGGVTSLVTNKAVQEDIKATDEQVKQLADWSKEFPKKAAEIRKDEGIEGGFGGGFGGGKIDPEQQKKIAAANAKIATEAYKQLGDVLKKDQIDRIKQIERQQLGLRAFTNAEVVEALKLTDSQKASVTGISGDFTKESREIMTEAGFGGGGFGGGGGKGGGKGGKGGGKGGFDNEKFQEAQKKVTKVQAEYTAKIVDVLDDSQKKTWKELIGEPFDVSKLTPTFGGFGKKDVKKD